MKWFGPKLTEIVPYI